MLKRFRFIIIFILIFMSLLPAMAADIPSEKTILNDGDRYFLSGDYESALREYRRAARLYPESRTAYISQGNTYVKMERYPEAVKAYKEALAIDPSFAPVHNNLGWVYLHSNQFDLAKKEFYEALRLDPEYARASVNLGLAYLGGGEYVAAETIFRQLCEKYPDEAANYNDLAISLAGQNRIAEAMEAIKSAAELSPKNPTVEVNYGFLEYLSRLPGKAIQRWKKALVISPDFVYAQVNLASAYYNMGNPVKAVSIWQRILENHPGNPSALGGLTGIYFMEGDLPKALLYAKKLVFYNPDLKAGHRNLGWIYLSYGNTRLADKEFEQAGGLESNDPIVIFGVAAVAEKDENLNLAFQAYSRGLELASNWGEAHYRLGLLYLKMKKMPEALAETEKAVEYGYKTQEARLLYARLLLENQRGSEAAGILKELLDKDPDLAEAEYLLARYYARKEMKETAVQHLKRACLLEEKYCQTWSSEPDLSPLIPLMKKSNDNQEPSGERLLNT
ncbi:MAG: tetratricopeptide repeat protein [Chloroflexi bacterium]|nr:tetratricopeptide repeat protein [Chloroflexota bacterium]